MMATSSARDAAAADAPSPDAMARLMLAAMARMVFSRRRTTLFLRREPTSEEPCSTGGDRGKPLVTSEMASSRSSARRAHGSGEGQVTSCRTAGGLGGEGRGEWTHRKEAARSRALDQSCLDAG